MTTKYGMTKRMAECLEFIRGYIKENGVPPSNAEITKGLGLRAVSGVIRLLRGLENRGHIVTKRGQARSIALVDDNEMELSKLREIREAAETFITSQIKWRGDVALQNDYNGQAEEVSHAFRMLSSFFPHGPITEPPENGAAAHIEDASLNGVAPIGQSLEIDHPNQDDQGQG